MKDRKVDQSALRTNQAFIVGLLILAFIFNNIWLVAFVGVVMLLGTAVSPLSLFKQLYFAGLKPAGIIKPDVIVDNPEPHRFAQGFGGFVVASAVAALLLGATELGWGLVWFVVALAALNLFVGFCAGCFVYYQLNKVGLPGFTRSPIKQQITRKT